RLRARAGAGHLLRARQCPPRPHQRARPPRAAAAGVRPGHRLGPARGRRRRAGAAAARRPVRARGPRRAAAHLARPLCRHLAFGRRSLAAPGTRRRGRGGRLAARPPRARGRGRRRCPRHPLRRRARRIGAPLPARARAGGGRRGGARNPVRARGRRSRPASRAHRLKAPAMSLILEALRKSEAERRRGAAPGLHVELPPAPPPRRGAPAWALAGGAAAGLALVALVLLWPRDHAPGGPAGAPVAPGAPARADAATRGGPPDDAAGAGATAPAPAAYPPVERIRPVPVAVDDAGPLALPPPAARAAEEAARA